jgi:hypothetical protein
MWLARALSMLYHRWDTRRIWEISMICSFPGCKAEAEWVTTHREPGTLADLEDGLCFEHYRYHIANYPDDADFWTEVGVTASETKEVG